MMAFYSVFCLLFARWLSTSFSRDFLILIVYVGWVRNLRRRSQIKIPLKSVFRLIKKFKLYFASIPFFSFSDYLLTHSTVKYTNIKYPFAGEWIQKRFFLSTKAFRQAKADNVIRIHENKNYSWQSFYREWDRWASALSFSLLPDLFQRRSKRSLVRNFLIFFSRGLKKRKKRKWHFAKKTKKKKRNLTTFIKGIPKIASMTQFLCIFYENEIVQTYSLLFSFQWNVSTVNKLSVCCYTGHKQTTTYINDD